MTVTILLIVAVLLIAGSLAIAIRTAKIRGQKIKELEVSLEGARVELRRQGEYQNQREEAQKNADEKKQTLHTGDSTADFDNSLGVLHGASKNRGS